MNDHELDEVLKSWTVPAAPAGIRQRMRAAFRANLGSRFHWFTTLRPRLGAYAALALVVLLLARAAPVVLGAPAAVAGAAFIVESETTYPGENGAPAVSTYRAAYDDMGKEIRFSRSIPNDHLGTLEQRGYDVLVLLHESLFGPIPGHHAEGNTASIAALRSAGCAIDPVIGHETILNFPAVGVRRTQADGYRFTSWMAPRLGCFALRYVVENRQPDGSFRLIKQTQALNVIAK